MCIVVHTLSLCDLRLVYDDYKFLTRAELDGIGLSHLIGTDFVRAYMHGFFLDIRLYRKVRNNLSHLVLLLLARLMGHYCFAH